MQMAGKEVPEKGHVWSWHGMFYTITNNHVAKIFYVADVFEFSQCLGAEWVQLLENNKFSLWKSSCCKCYMLGSLMAMFPTLCVSPEGHNVEQVWKFLYK